MATTEDTSEVVGTMTQEDADRVDGQSALARPAGDDDSSTFVRAFTEEEMENQRRVREREERAAPGYVPPPEPPMFDTSGMPVTDALLTMGGAIAGSVVGGVAAIPEIATGALINAVGGDQDARQTGEDIFRGGVSTLNTVQDFFAHEPQSPQVIGMGENIAGAFQSASESPLVATGLENLEGMREKAAIYGYEQTGSYLGAGLFASFPELIAEITPIKLGRMAAQKITGQKGRPPKGPGDYGVSKKDVEKTVVYNRPDIDELKEFSSGLYTEIAESGAQIKPGAFKKFATQVTNRVKQIGLDVSDSKVKRLDVTAGTNSVLKYMKEVTDSDSPLSLSDWEFLRQRLKTIQKNVGADGYAAGEVSRAMDTFIDKQPPGSFTITNGSSVSVDQIPGNFRAARAAWRAAKRSEFIDEMVRVADIDTAKGDISFGESLRRQAASMMKNKKKSSFFKPEELEAFTDLLEGNSVDSVLRFVGRLGFSDSQLTGRIAGIAAGGAGYAAGGFAGAAIAGAAIGGGGIVAKKIASKRTVKRLDGIENILLLQGRDKAIENYVRDYLKTLPKKDRNSRELATLFLDPRIDLDALAKVNNAIIKDAAILAKGRRAFNIGEGIGAIAYPVASTTADALTQPVPEQQQAVAQ